MRMTSPAPVIRYGSARSVIANGRMVRTATGCVNAMGLVCEARIRICAVSSEDAVPRNRFSQDQGTTDQPVQRSSAPSRRSLIRVRWWLNSACNLLLHREPSLVIFHNLMMPIVSPVHNSIESSVRVRPSRHSTGRVCDDIDPEPLKLLVDDRSLCEY